MPEHLTNSQRQLAYKALRGQSIRAAPWGELAEDRCWHLNQAARCLAALEARDWSEGTLEQLRGGMDWHAQLIEEINEESDRRQRAETRGYRDTPDSGPIAPERWAAARLIDCGLVLFALTGQAGHQRGDRWYFQCPFHQDDDPSLIGFPPGRGWHCFVCNAGGDAVQMVARFHGIGAGKALVLLESGALWLPFDAFDSAPGAGMAAR